VLGFGHPAEVVSGVDWNAVYAEHLPHVYNYFRYRVGDGPVAEDLTAVTFEKAWRSRKRYRADLAGFSTWLFTIARNTATDHFRRHKPTVSLDLIADLPGEPGVESQVERRRDFARLSALLGELDARERELVAMKYGAEMTNRAIAAVTGLSESNVGTILHRVVGKLREQWEDVR
jgi:RNA polymerase sigma-70 factor, ECF subfamily